MKQYIILCSILVLLSSCSNEPPSNPQATIEAIVDSTMAAIPTNTPLPTLTPEPTVTILPESTSTSGWITYINQAYGFSFWGDRQHPSPFYQDVNKLFQALSIVTNNRPRKSINPENFRQPLAPPLERK